MNEQAPFRDRERKLHRAQLAEARLLAIRRLQRRRRFRYAGALTLAAGVALVLASSGSGIAGPSDAAPTRGTRSAPLDELWIRGAIHLVDESGRELAVLGREQPIGPTVLGLYAPSLPDRDSEQTLRLATSDSGTALSVRTADGDSSVTVIAGSRGPEMELKQGSRRRVITHLSEAPLAAATRGRALPAVGAAPPGGPEIDLAVSEIQNIGGGFMVSGLSATEEAGGVRVSGRMINTTSVKHRALSFRMTLNGQSEVFEIGLISPGNSTGFSVKLPGPKMASAGLARIELMGSTINYLGHSLRGIDGVFNAGR